MLKVTQKQKGFTLIEALVATSLFAVTVVSVVSVYLTTIRINRRTDTIRTAAENARFITEYLSKEIKNGSIDYNSSPPPGNPCVALPPASGSTLAVLNTLNERLCFYIGDNTGLVSASGPNLWLKKNNLAAVKVNSTNVKIPRLVFYVAPANIDPYTSGSTIQPRVTIVGSVQTTTGGQDTITIPLQTTISIPNYDVPQP